MEPLLSLGHEARAASTLERQPLLRSFLHHIEDPMGPTDFGTDLATNKIYRCIIGQDAPSPQLMSETEINEKLGDPFAELLLKQGIFPLTINATIEGFENTKNHPKGLKSLFVFHIAEGGQIPWSEETAKVNRSFRLVFSLKVKEGIGPDVLISTGKNVDSHTQFLQLMSWDPKNRVFNFYQRMLSLWIWAGNSAHALEPATRGKGPFSGHINGGPIMKELKQPWAHWKSMNAQINATIFTPGDPFVNHRFFASDLVKGGETLELIVKSGIGILNASRLEKAIVNQKLSPLPHFLRQILETTTVNLTSSAQLSSEIDEETDVVLPFTFFCNFQALSALGISIATTPVKVSGQFYLETLKQFDYALVSEDIKIPGDTHFAFLTPEPGAEDIDLLQKLIKAEAISPRLAACLLMVDFTNPLYSKKRAHLLFYVPHEIFVGNSGKDLDEKFLRNIFKSKKHTENGTPEKAFIDNWSISEDTWKDVFVQKITEYFDHVQNKVTTLHGYQDLVRLAESRRTIFKKSKLFEFPLTFAQTNLPEQILEITPQGEVQSIIET